MDRDLARVQPRNPGSVDVDANDVIARVRKAGTGDEADVAGSEDRDLQDRSLIFLRKSAGRLANARASVKRRLRPA